jgi:hypothetical protein
MGGVELGQKGAVHENERVLMNEQIEEKKSPEVKPAGRRLGMFGAHSIASLESFIRQTSRRLGSIVSPKKSGSRAKEML